MLVLPGFAQVKTDNRRTRQQAVALVRRAARFVREQGKERALAEFNKPDGRFIDGELYIFAYGNSGDGVLLANPMFPLLVGKNLLDMTDANGVAITRRVLEIGASKTGKGWIDYHWPNRLKGRNVELKTSYIELADGLILGCGLPKR